MFPTIFDQIENVVEFLQGTSKNEGENGRKNLRNSLGTFDATSAVSVRSQRFDAACREFDFRSFLPMEQILRRATDVRPDLNESFDNRSFVRLRVTHADIRRIDERFAT